MNIEHKLEPIEHWIVDGKAYRLAAENDVGNEVTRSMESIDDCLLDADYGAIATLVTVHRDTPRFDTGSRWKFAVIQDDSLLAPQRTPVPALGDGWFLLRDDEVIEKGDMVAADGGGFIEARSSVGHRVRDYSGVLRAARYFGPAKEPPPTAEQPQPKPIDWTKPVRTKDGRAVRVLCTDGPEGCPVIGIVDGVGPENWMIDGTWLEGEVSDLDLENAPQRIQREYWVNVYPGNIGEVCMTKQAADGLAKYKRLACVKITIDCEEGEGL